VNFLDLVGAFGAFVSFVVFAEVVAMSDARVLGP
jgi:hypothetical protein